MQLCPDRPPVRGTGSVAGVALCLNDAWLRVVAGEFYDSLGAIVVSVEYLRDILLTADHLRARSGSILIVAPVVVFGRDFMGGLVPHIEFAVRVDIAPQDA